jgi:hypothetical protein
MALISGLSSKDLIDLQNKIASQVEGCATLEDAAQHYMSILYETLSESIVLVRLFAMIPYQKLPQANKEFVANLAESANITELIQDQTLVLSLLGSRGEKPEWNDRHNSKGHVGIPLASADFIDRIPMMSRLLKQLGAGIDWIDDYDTELVAKTFQNISGVFHVRDAKSELDSQGRNIIAAQDFVEAEGVKTVFGVGGCYMGTSLFFATIVFVRELLDRDTVERFMLQANKFKTATFELVDTGKIFA